MKVCVVTGSRAEYGLLYPLMRELSAAKDIHMQCVVTGAHLSDEFGLTYKEIEEDGFDIDARVENISESDSQRAMAKSTSAGISGFADVLENLKPDLMVLLGDRFEIFAAATSAVFARIPIAHIHGGELTEGAMDEFLRHAITKMSYLHFTAAEEYRNRVIQMGEEPDRVFNVGAMALDNINSLKQMTQDELETELSFKFGRKTLLITYHPATLITDSVTEGFRNLLHVLNEISGTTLIFTKSNADAEGRLVNQMIDEFVANDTANRFVFSSLGRVRYLSILKYVDGIVGNTSSGIIEAPSFKIGTVNIGQRQAGRIRAQSVIDCVASKDDIARAMDVLFSKKFQHGLRNTKNPYGSGGAAQAIMNVIKTRTGLLSNKKKFYDILVQQAASL